MDTGNGGRAPAGEIRKPPAAVMRVANRLVRPLLNSRMHSLASPRLLLLEYTGRRTGTRYTIPIAYAEVGAHDLVAASVGTAWPSSVDGLAVVRVRLRGRWHEAEPTVLTDPDAVAAALGRLISLRGPAAVAPLRLGLPTDRLATAGELRDIGRQIRLVQFRLVD